MGKVSSLQNPAQLGPHLPGFLRPQGESWHTAGYPARGSLVYHTWEAHTGHSSDLKPIAQSGAPGVHEGSLGPESHGPQGPVVGEFQPAWNLEVGVASQVGFHIKEKQTEEGSSSSP